MLTLPADLDRRLRAGGAGLTVAAIRLGAMGDVLRTVPAVRLLRRALPDAAILWMVESTWSVLVDGHRDLDGSIVVPRRDWSRALGEPAAWPGLANRIPAFLHELRARGVDLVLDFHGNLRSGLLGYLTGAAVRVGYDGHQQKEGNRRFTSHRVASGDRRTPRMERNLDLLRGLGIPETPLPPAALSLPGRGRAESEAVLRAMGAPSGVAVLSPAVSARQAYKKPPAELLAAACERLHDRGLATLVVHGPGEVEDARRVVATARRGAVLAPPTDLPTLAALLERAALFIGGDTGPLHLACAVGCPVLGLYGPTDPRVNRPWGVPFRALAPPGRRYTGIKSEDREAGGFDGLTPDLVQAAVDELLRDDSTRASAPGLPRGAPGPAPPAEADP